MLGDETRFYQVVTTFSVKDGGPSRHAMEVNFALNQLGLHVQLIAVRSATQSVIDEASERLDFPTSAPMTVREISRLRRPLPLRMRPFFAADAWILHGYYLMWLPPVVLLAKLLSIPIFVMPHGSLTAFDRKKSRFKKLAFRYLWFGWLIDRSAVFIVASALEAEELPSSIDCRHVHIVGAGAQLPADAIGDRPAHRPLELVSLSRIAPKKRIDLCIRAVSILARAGFMVRLSVAGDGDPAEVSRLEKIARDLGVIPHVRFVGHVSGVEKERLLSESDIFLLPSDDENFGIAVAEAMAHGLPVVVSARVGAAEGVPDDAGAVLRDPSAADIAEAIMRLTDEYGFHRERALRFAQRTFSWRAVGERWLSAIEATVDCVDTPGR